MNKWHILSEARIDPGLAMAQWNGLEGVPLVPPRPPSQRPAEPPTLPGKTQPVW
jgi:hypothetical protein